MGKRQHSRTTARSFLNTTSLPFLVFNTQIASHRGSLHSRQIIQSKCANAQQDADILEPYRPFRKGILPGNTIAAVRERSEAYLRIGELIGISTHRHPHFTSLRI